MGGGEGKRVGTEGGEMGKEGSFWEIGSGREREEGRGRFEKEVNRVMNTCW